MNIYFAPLEGVTDIVFRKTHHEMFSGVTKYFIPFVSPTQHMTFSSREQAALLPENNKGIPVAVQILTKEADLFIRMTEMLRDLGYTEANLNLGCPSGTVTGKGKGSAMLRDPDALDRFLNVIYEKTDLPVSIKTRIGYESEEEWPRIREIFLRYPISELIIHPRTRQQFYKGNPHTDAVLSMFECAKCPVVYNGDLFTETDCRQILTKIPTASALMLGRGLIANPCLSETISNGAKATKEKLRAFHDKLFERYLETWPKNALVGHMHEIMYYMTASFEDPQKPRKAIRKSSTIDQYLKAVDELFEKHALTEDAGFVPYL